MFSVEDFQKLKGHLPPGSLGISFSLKPQVRIHITDNTSYGRGWEVRLLEESTARMCILTEKDGQISADYRLLVRLPAGNGYDFQPLSDPDFAERAQVVFRESVVFLERKRAEEQEANRLATEQLLRLAHDEAAMQRWRALVQLLVSDPARAEKIGKATARAFKTPETFLKRLNLRRVSEHVPWLALIHALKKERLLVEFDWKEDPGDVSAGIDRLCALDWSTITDEKTADRLNAASQALQSTGLMLVWLDRDGDSFPTAAIPSASFEAASSHAAAFGCRLLATFA